MSITFPENPPQVDTTAVSDVGGSEKYNSIDGNSITVTNITAESVTAGWVYAGNINAGQINTGTIASNIIYAGNITASQIVSGTITVGGTSQPTAITINESSLTGNARLGWEHGSRMWEDSSSRLGINSIGSPMIFYVNSSEIFQMNTAGGVGNGAINVTGRVVCKELLLNQGQNEGSIDKIDYLIGYNDLRVRGNGDVRFYRDTSDNPGVRFEWGTGKIFSYDSNINLAGTDKTAIVPVQYGYKALYSVESPEVWFMDFCEGHRIINTSSKWKFWKWYLDWKIKPDIAFMEVTQPPYMITPTGHKGIVQIWGHRKGHAAKRFETKTEDEFKKNEAFLKQSKC